MKSSPLSLASALHKTNPSAVKTSQRPRFNLLQRTLSCLLALTLSIGNIPLTYAQVISDPNAGPYRPQVITPPNSNGVPVVNITAPSGAGVSRNQYQQFDVQQQGVILNNSRNNANTQLAGWIQGNPNLAGGQARIILNEVTSGNPSMLRGYVEVGGGRAEVIIANPAGIAVDGGGFINASGVTLTTGTPQFSATGNLESFRVGGAGHISIDGKGLDTRGADYTAIISRAAQINSGIWANDLRITAGTGVVGSDATPISLTVEDASGNPLFAIDVAELGGMYAGKIRLIGTEAGVGVRNAGHIGASAGQVTVTADGQLINTGTLNSAASTPAGAGIQVAAANITNSGTLYTQGDLQLTTDGQLLNTGTLAGAGHTHITAQTIQNQNDTGTGQIAVIAGGMGSDGQLTGYGDVSLNATQTITNTGSILAQNNASLSATTLTNSAAVHANQNITLQADNITNSGTLYAKSSLHANATQTLTNQGTLAALGNTTINAQTIDNHNNALIAAGLNSQGQYAGNASASANAGNLQINATGALTNSGTLAAQGHTTLNAQTLHNQNTALIASGINAQGQFAGAGNTHITASQSITNAGEIYSGQNTTLTAQAIANQNKIHAAQNATLNANTLNNQNGSIAALGTATLQAQTLNNQSGTLTAQNITLEGQGGAGTATQLNNALGLIASTANIQAQANSLDNTSGKLHAAGDISLILSGNYTNAQTSQIIANNALDLQVTGNLTNAGSLLGGLSTSVTATHINNTATGEIAATSTTVTATGAPDSSITNRGLIDGANTTVKGPTITNLGTGRIYGDHLAIQAQVLTNTDEAATAAVLAARQRMDLGVGTLNNQNNAIIYSVGDMHVGGTLDSANQATGTATLIQNDGATLESGGNMTITAAQVNNTNPVYLTQQVTSDGGHRTVILWGPNEYDLSEIFVLYGVAGAQTYPDRLSGSTILWAGSNLFQLQGVLGTADHHYIILPSTNGRFPSDIFGPAGGLTQIPQLAYKPERSEYEDEHWVSKPEEFQYDHTSSMWTLFGVTAPTQRPEAPGYICGGDEGAICNTAQQQHYNAYVAADNAWKIANKPLYLALNTQIQDFYSDLKTRMVEEHFIVQDFDITEHADQVISSRPGQILSGGTLTINGNVINDKSQIMAGGNLNINGSVTQIDAKGQNFDTYAGTSQESYMEGHSVANDDRRWRWTLFNRQTPPVTETLLVDALPQGNTAITGSGTTVGNLGTSGVTVVPVDNTTSVSTVAPNINIPTSNLYKVNPGSGNRYLIETDPKFTRYGNWLTSDYMLGSLGLDASIAKRLGDGFYEQQLIREQIGQLTGYRFLGGYQSDEEQYKALMNAGVEFAKELRLSVGIALTAEQMASLTTDIVWLVSTQVTLPDGSIETVLAPQVYTRGGASMITAGGTLMSGNNVIIQSTNPDGTSQEITLDNTATIAARSGLFVDVAHLQNTLGQLHGNDVLLNSASDINNVGGILSADNSLTLVAGRDIHISSTVVEGKDTSGHITGIGNTGIVYLSGQGDATPGSANNGQIRMQAGRDVNLSAAYIANDALSQMLALPAKTSEGDNGTNNGTNNGTSAPNPTSQAQQQDGAQPGETLYQITTPATTIVAGGSIRVGTVGISQSHDITFDPKNFHRQSTTTEIGTTIATQGDINLVAGDHVGVRASNLQSTQGAINVVGNTITLQAGDASSSYSRGIHSNEKDLMSSGSKTTQTNLGLTQLVASSLSAEEINLSATRDIHISASDVVATHNVNIISREGDVNITSGVQASRVYEYENLQESGLIGVSASAASFGHRTTTTTDTTDTTSARSSTVGSLQGNVNISAQSGTYNQIGSDVLALQGDINVVAGDINIVESRETSRHENHYEMSQTALSIGVSSPLIAVIETAQQMSEAADNTSSGRMKALAVGAAALKGYNTAQDFALAEMAARNPGSQGASGLFSFTLGLGSSKAESHALEQSDSAKGSSMTAGGNINLVATGRPGQTGQPNSGGNITIQGSNITAGNNATLIANEEINILAASNTASSQSSNQSSSSSVGVSFGLGSGWGLNASTSNSKGNSNTADQSWTASHITAGNTTTLISGGDTNLIGSQVAGNRVVADIGGNLNIQSLQNTSLEHSQQRSSSASISTSFNGSSNIGSSGNISHSKLNADGIYASVNDYAGIMAGDGGFQINVQGNTDLKGAIIASTQNAVDANKNSLTTGSLTVGNILNTSQYDSSGSSMSAGASFGNGKIGASLPIPLQSKDSSSDMSVTGSGISAGAITITNEDAQKELTGQTAEEAIAGINTDVRTGDSANGIDKDWNTQQLIDEMQANMDIAQVAVGELGALVANKSKERQLLDDMKEHPERYNLTAEEIAGLDDQLKALETWAPGGESRLIVTALMGAISGNVSGTDLEFIQSALVNAIQGLGASEIKDLVNSEFGGDDKVRAALHAILACGGAAAQGADCASGALGAAGSVVLHNLMGNKIKDPVTGEMRDLNAQEQEERLNLVNTIIAGIAGASGGDAVIANIAAKLEGENNTLNSHQVKKLLSLETKYLELCQGSAASSVFCLNTRLEIDALKNEALLIEVTKPYTNELAYTPGEIVPCPGGSGSGFCIVSDTLKYDERGNEELGHIPNLPQWELHPISEEYTKEALSRYLSDFGNAMFDGNCRADPMCSSLVAVSGAHPIRGKLSDEELQSWRVSAAITVGGTAAAAAGILSSSKPNFVIGKGGTPTSSVVLDNTTFQASVSMRLPNGTLIPAGSIVTTSSANNALKIVTPDGATTRMTYSSAMGAGKVNDAAKKADELLQAANKPFNNQGLSAAARAWEKHAGRPGGSFPALSGNISQKNQAASDFVNDILSNPRTIQTNLSRGGVEYRLPNGQGIRYNADGSFSGFLDPRKPLP